MSWLDGIPPTVAEFRAALSAFADPQRYSDGEIQPWLYLAGGVPVGTPGLASTPPALDPARWCQWWSMGQLLFAAHFLVLNRRDELTADAGGVPGGSVGVVSSKSVGAASIGYDVQGSLEKDGGQWNLTTYGRQFLRLSRMVGMGGVQIEPCVPALGPGFGAPWPGVIY